MCYYLSLLDSNYEEYKINYYNSLRKFILTKAFRFKYKIPYVYKYIIIFSFPLKL